MPLMALSPFPSPKFHKRLSSWRSIINDTNCRSGNVDDPLHGDTLHFLAFDVNAKIIEIKTPQEFSQRRNMSFLFWSNYGPVSLHKGKCERLERSGVDSSVVEFCRIASTQAKQLDRFVVKKEMTLAATQLHDRIDRLGRNCILLSLNSNHYRLNVALT